MCAIFGSYDPFEFIELAKLNSYRGGHSYSISYYDGNNITFISRNFGEFPYDYDLKHNGHFFIGHVQAPTTEARGLDAVHPAMLGESMLWHNGIIKDHYVKQMQKEYSDDCQWDTKLVLQSIDQKGYNCLSDIDGSFACLYFDSKKLSLFRNTNSPIFTSKSTFSSTKFKEAVELPSDVVYNLISNEWKDSGTKFSTSNNFYWSFE